MDDRSSTQSFQNHHHHHHHHRPTCHLTLPSLQRPEVEYSSSQPSLDPLEQYDSRGEESTNSFPMSNTYSGGRAGSSGGERGLFNAGGLEGDSNVEGHNGDSRLDSHFAEDWYGSSKKEDLWEDREGCESPADDLFDHYSATNDVFYPTNCGSEGGIRHKLKANHGNDTHVSYESKSKTVFKREASVSHLTKPTTPFNRNAAWSYSDSSVDYCRTDSRLSDSYAGREEDYGSSCGSGEDQLQQAEFSFSPSSQAGEGRWRGTAENYVLAPGCLAQRSSASDSSGTYTQKLDSFSEAFLSQRKGRLPTVPGGDSSGEVWGFGPGQGDGPGFATPRHSCTFDSDSYPPPSSSSSSSLAQPSLSSFPSPPASSSSHLASSVLSPPPTPLPPPSNSPSKMDSPVSLGGTGPSASHGAESLGPLQFFASHLQSLSSVHSPGMMWTFPLLQHGFPQQPGDSGNAEGNLWSSHGSDYGNITAPHEIIHSPETFLTSSNRSSFHPPRALCPYNIQPLHSSFHLPSQSSHLPGQRFETAPHTVKEKHGPASLSQSKPQPQGPSIYTGTSFPSNLHSNRGQKRGHYTPRPLLNPSRRGKGLYSCLHHVKQEPAQEEDYEACSVLPCVNVGGDFQATVPPCPMGDDDEGSRGWSSSEEEAPGEQLLWKPWDQLEESAYFQDQVEKLLSMCSSSCLPGGGSNTELALHCLHYTRGDTMATLEMLLFSQPSPTGDYHYPGSDRWTDSERRLFGEALGIHGKDFSLVQKMVKTKTVSQCVEFYYLSKKLHDKQTKQREEEIAIVAEMEQQKNISPVCQPADRQFGVEEAIAAPSLASFFPCKLCGKMFYKIKSRNAHMKIHRQPQEDWSDRRLQHQILSQRLAVGRPPNLMPNPGTKLLQPQAPALSFPPLGLQGISSTNGNNKADNALNSAVGGNSHARVLGPGTLATYGSSITPSNSHAITNAEGCDSNQREPTAVLPFHQAWGSFGQGADPSYF